MGKLVLALVVALFACGDSKSSSKKASGAEAEKAQPTECRDLTSCAAVCNACTSTCTPAQAKACYRQAHRLEGAKVIDLPKIASLHEKACNAGYGAGCAALAVMYMDGRGRKPDENRAGALALDACEKGSGVACFNLAMWERGGLLRQIDEAKAAKHMAMAEKNYKAECAAGEHVWCMNLGVMYEEGFIGEPDPARAEPIYRKSCDAGHGDSCVNLALMQLEQAKDHTAAPDALPLLSKSCEGGSALACGVLGQLYIKARYGIAKQPAKALELLERGCAGGAKQACGVAGAVYALGDDVAPNPKLTLDFEKRACDLGDSLGCFGVASQARRQGPSANPLVFKYLERGCQIGHARSCELLASMLSRGVEGVAKNLERSAWARVRACRRGAMRTCAMLVRAKIPLPLPPARAKAMRTRLCMQGVREACAAE